MTDTIEEVFLLYDLEFAYGAAIHLAMANALFPQEVDGHARSEEAHKILSGMVCNGNRVAEVRRDELIHLEALFQELSLRVESSGLQPLTLSTPDDPDGAAFQVIQGTQGQDEHIDDSGILTLPTPMYPQSPETADLQVPSVEFLENIGISSAEFFCILDQINGPGVPCSILDQESTEDM